MVSGRHFDTWWKQARRDNPKLLDFDVEMLTNDAGARFSKDDYPDQLGGLDLSYQFEPGVAADGVTVTVPLPQLASLQPDASSTGRFPGCGTT